LTSIVAHLQERNAKFIKDKHTNYFLSTLKYLSPRSGRITTIFPESSFSDKRKAAYMAAPEEMPQKIPSSFIKRFQVLII